ncbi:MAG: hypothetical protein QXF76_01340 [Candidatus Anstonellales archaeon]
MIDWYLIENVIEIKLSYGKDSLKGYNYVDTKIYVTDFPSLISCSKTEKIVVRVWLNKHMVIC